ncbi:MAG: TraB/GumN family protein [Chakrabartia sp.]
MRHAMARPAIWALAGLTCLFAGQSVSAAPAPHPAIWKIADADTTIYLFGTTHSLPKGLRWQSPQLKQIARAADELVVESLEDAAARQKTDQAVDAAITPVVDNRPILTRVAEDKRPALAKAILQTDFPTQFYDAMPTWMASLVLAVETMSKQGSRQDQGVEAKLIAQFRHRHRAVLAVEDGSLILRQMHQLSDAAQTRMLEGTLDDMAGASAAPDAANLAWASGDLAALEDGFSRAKLGDELYEMLILKRNQAWSQWLAARLQRPGIVLFAVGAGHFAGPDGLPHMLAQKGFSLTRAD